MTTTQEQAAASIDSHGGTIDELHRKLAAIPNADKDRLQKAVDKYRAAHAQFRDDALGCMN
jgi:hypothetical protein